MNFARTLRDWRYRCFYGLLLSRRHTLVSMGNPTTGCGWTFHPGGLGPASVVYSGGVGNDISFEHALVERFGCQVVLFDPSPTGTATMAKPENQLPQFRYFPVGLAGREGHLTLAPPLNPEEGSWFMHGGSARTIQVPCTDLGSLMHRSGHTHVDLLKLDIEGTEYEVLDDLLKSRIPVRQICVEFHHGMLPGIRRSQSIRAMLRLLARGYQLLSQDGNNHTFLRRGAWAEPKPLIANAT